MSDYVDIIGYEKLYGINREGSVWSYVRNKEVKQYLIYGYYVLKLCKKNYKLHRLLALQFLPNPLELPCIDHINGNRTDNRLENLRWVTYRQNNNNRKDNTLHPLIYVLPSGKYRVQFKINGKNTYFGNYKTLDEALSERDCRMDLLGLENCCYS